MLKLAQHWQREQDFPSGPYSIFARIINRPARRQNCIL
jgi:hypothetical protein